MPSNALLSANCHLPKLTLIAEHSPPVQPAATWSQQLIDLTREALAHPCAFNGGIIHLKRRSGGFGWIYVTDALACSWVVHDKIHGSVAQFSTIDHFIAAGWALD